ncbi:hypothetical protein PIB30_072617 [Stylosanthes scabra]|uniref:Uncharacterized protein n=1 Tax=Stylosanthes scabra TaxID=79078 RepID=A0ABU6WNT9_9FABA|nr:hypothetical protein [Stylosanthes scabra]
MIVKRKGRSFSRWPAKRQRSKEDGAARKDGSGSSLRGPIFRILRRWLQAVSPRAAPTSGYVSAVAPGNPDGEGGVKAPFSTAAGDGEDDSEASEVRTGARRRMATAEKWRFGWGLC